MLTKFVFQPGIIADSTRYAAEGAWADGDKMRFRMGLPEKIGGWVAYAKSAYLGVARTLHNWFDLLGDRFLAVGTTYKLYVESSDYLYDVTPIRSGTATLPVNPFLPTGGGSTIVTVTDPNHGKVVGDVVSFSGATGSPNMNGQWTIATVVDVSHYTINSGTAVAGAGVAYGGSAVVVQHAPLLSNPFLPTGGGSRIITVTDANHGAQANDFVVFSGATGSPNLNGEWQILAIVDANRYTIDSGVVVSGAGVAYGGSAVIANYQISTGVDQNATGTGYGIGPYGRGAWGSAVNIVTPGLRIWSLDNFGQDLIAVPSYGPPSVWQAANGTQTRAIEIKTLAATPGDVPNLASFGLVSEDRHVILYGTNDYLSATFDPMLVRWSNQQDYTNWTVSTTTTAGSQRMSIGSFLVAALKTKGEILVWSDKALFSQQFIGPPYTFGFRTITDSVSIAGQLAAVNAHNSVYWMDQRNFYVYNGSVSALPCPLLSYVFSNINMPQIGKVHAGFNSEFNEVKWFYPSLTSEECDLYVAYNILTNDWTKGTMQRTAWEDMARSGKPVAANNGKLYQHEVGWDAVEDPSNPATGTLPLDVFIESADFDLGDGDSFQYCTRVLPDLLFFNPGSASAAGVTVSMKARNFPGDPLALWASGLVYPPTPDTYTPAQLDVRVRGRQGVLRFESSGLGIGWRLGATRLDLRTDGRK